MAERKEKQKIKLHQLDQKSLTKSVQRARDDLITFNRWLKLPLQDLAAAFDRECS